MGLAIGSHIPDAQNPRQPNIQLISTLRNPFRSAPPPKIKVSFIFLVVAVKLVALEQPFPGWQAPV